MRIVFNRSSLLAALTLPFACGAPDEWDDSLDLGQAEQAFAAPASPSFQLGTTTSSARLQCGRTNSGQVCSVPLMNSKAVLWRFGANSGFSDQQKADFRIVMTAVDNVLPSWTFTESTSQAAAIVVDKAACSGSSSSNNIEAFSCIDLSGPEIDLEEGPGVVGQYTAHVFGDVHIDFDDIDAKFSSAADRLALAQHAFGHGIISWLGLGSRSDSGALGFVSRRQVNLNVLNLPLTQGEACRLEAYDITNNGAFDLLSPACTSD
jgi:hypothetical protein